MSEKEKERKWEWKQTQEIYISFQFQCFGFSIFCVQCKFRYFNTSASGCSECIFLYLHKQAKYICDFCFFHVRLLNFFFFSFSFFFCMHSCILRTHIFIQTHRMDFLTFLKKKKYTKNLNSERAVLNDHFVYILCIQILHSACVYALIYTSQKKKSERTVCYILANLSVKITDFILFQTVFWAQPNFFNVNITFKTST